MAKINQPPKAPMWPWGGPRSIRERLVDPAQLDRKRKAKGNLKNPALASQALLDFIGPAHSSDELRLPMPPFPGGHEADLGALSDRPQLQSLMDRATAEVNVAVEKGLERLNATPERLDRLRSLLGREEEMLALMGELREQVEEIHRRRREEQKDAGY